MIEFESTIKKIGWKAEPIVSPISSEEDEQWFSVFSKFGASGFLRLLASDQHAGIQAAHPEIEPMEIQSVLETLGEQWKQESGYFISKLVNEDYALSIFAFVEKLADALISEDVSSKFTALKPKTSKDQVRDMKTGSEADSEKNENVFEEIGTREEDTNTVSNDKANDFTVGSSDFSYRIRVDKNLIDVLIGISPEIPATAYERLGQTFLRHFRAKFDVEPKLAKGMSVQGFESFAHRVHVHCVPDTDRAIDTEKEAIQMYLQKLVDLSEAGVDPLVFLGVLQSQREHASAARTTEKAGEGSTFALSFEDDEFELNSTEVALELNENKNADLKPGDFEDSRLQERDATTAFVDVVLRHPGYSDKNMGQVLSILLSIDYHDALEIVSLSPTVIAWEVSRERGQMIKTVIEGAGGKVFLSEPRAFAVN